MQQAFDAQAAMGFLQSQTSHIEAEVNKTVYPDIQYQDLIPVDSSAPEFAKTVTYYSQDQFGQADWINGNASDIPLVGLEHNKYETSIHTAAVGYGYGYEELMQARMLNVNLTADKAMTARRAYEEKVDVVAIKGDATKGFQGLINNTGVTVAAATNGDWDTATPDEKLADVNNAIIGTATDTAHTSIANTLIMSPEKLNKLATTRLTDSSYTILKFLRENNAYTAMTGKPLTIRGVRGLDTAGAGGVERMITYRKDPQVLKLHIPMKHRFLPVYQSGPLRFVVPGVFRLGGTDIRRPKEVRYTDGI